MAPSRKEEVFVKLLQGIQQYPVSLSGLVARAEGHEPRLLNGLTVRNYARVFHARGELDMRKIGSTLVIFGWKPAQKVNINAV